MTPVLRAILVPLSPSEEDEVKEENAFFESVERQCGKFEKKQDKKVHNYGQMGIMVEASRDKLGVKRSVPGKTRNMHVPKAERALSFVLKGCLDSLSRGIVPGNASFGETKAIQGPTRLLLQAQIILWSALLKRGKGRALAALPRVSAQRMCC